MENETMHNMEAKVEGNTTGMAVLAAGGAAIAAVAGGAGYYVGLLRGRKQAKDELQGQIDNLKEMIDNLKPQQATLGP